MIKKIEKNNVTIALNVLYAKKEKIYHAYISKHNSNHEKQIILFMISNGEKREGKSAGRWHYLAVKKLSALLRGITSKHNGDFCCLNCLPSRHVTSRGRPLKVLTSGISRGPSANSWGTNTKSDDLMKKLFFRCNSPCFTHLLLFFNGKSNIQKF